MKFAVKGLFGKVGILDYLIRFDNPSPRFVTLFWFLGTLL